MGFRLGDEKCIVTPEFKPSAWRVLHRPLPPTLLSAMSDKQRATTVARSVWPKQLRIFWKTQTAAGVDLPMVRF
jgi:hypothetical protein